MTTLRSSLPARLRQLLSGEGAVGPSLKLESEPPPAIKAFIDKVIKSPLCDIAIPLSGFSWEYNKGNFHHWRPLFLHFDTYFKTYISCRKDLLLSDNISDDDGAFPKHAVLQILRVMQTILENCPNKSSFAGVEHFKLLLASTDPEILIATLETLCALMKINPSKLHVSGKLIGCGSINSYLLSLAQGWGSKEEGLGLYSCVMANERIQVPSDVESECAKSQYRLGSTLYFEFHGVNTHSTEETGTMTRSSDLRVIHIPDLHTRKEDDLLLLKQCVEQYTVPLEHRFSLLTRIRYARSFRSPGACRLYSRICLLAFIVLVQSNDAHDEIVSFFANEPEYTNELIKIVRSEEAIPGTIKTLAMLALAAQLAAYSSSHERARILSGSSIISAGGNRMILLNVLQKAVMSLKNSSDPSTLSFVEALLQFYMLHVISSSSSGSAIRGSGMVPTLLPVLQDVDSTHMHLVCLAVKALQKLMDYSNAAVSLFKDLGGVELLAQRLQIEVSRVTGVASQSDNSMIIGEIPRFDDDLLYSQKRLIKALLKALGSATYAPANSSRSQNSHENSLPGSLSLIFRNVERFGGDIYFSAVTVMSELIHKDPTCFSALHELGLPDSFLSSVVAGILPSSKAITCVPSGLGAICLNAKGLEAVKETMALRFLVDIFTSRKYVLAMNEGVVPLANAVEELLRHVSSLRGTGVDIIIEIIDKLGSLGDDVCSSEKGESSNAMETDSEDKENDGHSSLVSGMNSTSDGISDERFTQLCIFHVMVLVHRTMENSETCRLFVEKKGIEALMRLLLRPSIAQSSEGMSIALHSTVVFKGFTQHHSAPLAHAFCSSLRDHLKKALAGFGSASGSFLLAPRSTPDKVIFSSLFIVEFLLFLAASKDSRWVAALLTEFGNGSKDVLEDIGRVHREVLWQIALLEDSKLEMEDNSSGSTTDSQRLETNTNETEEQRFNSFRQFLDPLIRRRISGWSVESQFFDLLNLYRDLGRATGGQQRLGMDGSSNLRLGSGPQLHLSGSSEATTGTSKMEGDKQRSYYSSCCDMMRSLSFHISHLFLELGKVMLQPSRRRDDSLNVSPSSKSVVSTFASIVLDHLNFGGHIDPSRSEASISTKCRYLGKVIDFIDGILLDRPDSCNPILVNCFYGHGVVQAVLTTFEATSQLLFAVNRAPASPMETDDGNSNQGEKEETDHSWIYGPLASYGTLMDHLVTSAFIISPFTKHLLAQPLTNGNIPFPRDAEAFVKVLQSMVLKAVLPIWSHPQFADCSYEFITTIVSIMRHIYSGVEVKNVNNTTGARASAPPPNEAAISTIVEMGFSRLRAEEALRQVGTNSVEMAMEWLFSHPEEVQEDDELARALAMSLGNSGKSTMEDVENEVIPEQEEETLQLPPVDELLSTCTRLLQVKESLAFPIRDLLVMICSQHDGQYRLKVISFIIDHVKLCSSISDSGSSTVLSALFHVLALVLHEDAVAREVASKNGLVPIASDLLSQWDPSSHGGQKLQVPKWVTSSFLAIDRLLQVDPKLSSELPEQLKKDDLNSHQSSVVIDEDKPNTLQSTLGLGRLCISVHEQKRLVEIACRCIKHQVPSETMHVVLQLCATLTRTHSVAVSFLDEGGLHSLLSLPTCSLFSGFDNIAATIVRHILEDPQTLQQAMEAEIRHSLVAATNRHSNGRLTPRNFLLNLASVISRDPVVFMQAAQSVCQIEMVGERPYIVLLKDREKEKCKEKDKRQTADGKTVSCDINSITPGSGNGKVPDSNSKNAKVHRKSPQSFTSVVELLLDSVITFVPSPKDDASTDGVLGAPTLAEMDIDDTANKGKGKAVVTVPEHSEPNNQEASASLAKTVFVLKLLTEILLTYSSSVHVLLRRDAEVSSCRGPPPRGPTENCSGGIFHHILHKFLPYSGSYKKEKKVDGDWRQKLATRAGQFLVASCIRSTEGRKRVFTDINNVFNEFVDSSDGFRPPDCYIHAYIDLLNDILAARSPTGSYISAEASATFIEVGLVRSMTRTLRVLDLDHADSPKVVTGLVKALESVTKEHVHAADSSSAKGENSEKPPDQNQPGRTETDGDRFQSSETTYQPGHNEVVSDHIGPFNAVQTSGSSESITDDMEHDRDLDGGFAPGTEDDFMHDTSEETGGLENGMETVGIRFDIQHNGQNNLGDEDDDEEMSEDDGDEVDEDDDEDDDDEEHHDLEEDEVHHMSHPDTDQDDHEIDEDEFDEDVLEEEDEDDEDDEDGVILRLEEGINGINVFDHIEVFGRENSFPSDTLHVMPVDVFGSRRQGRTTSIYNLLGRTGENGVPSQHPLLTEPSSTLHPSPFRQSENAGDIVLSDRNLENASSRLDTIFRSLRNGRHGHRFNMWVDDSQQRGGSNAPVIPQGLEELLVSQLRRPTPDKPSENTNTMEPQVKGEGVPLEESGGVRVETSVENNGNVSVPTPGSELIVGAGSSDVTPEANDFLPGMDASSTHTQAVDMQYERNEAVVRDVEAVSQESSGSGATLGESLRSLEVEIGSADGHDDGGERHGSTDRLPLGDLQPARTRRTSAPMGNVVPTSSRDASLQSVSEVSESPGQGADQSLPANEQQINRVVDSGSIDPAFLDALPEELRAEVLSAQHGQVAQPSDAQPQSAGDIDPEFLAALPPDIRAEVLAQQEAQRLHQSQELEGQPVEMDTVSIIATFPSDLREEVLLTSSDAILANLTPALVAEATMLRERFAHRYHSRTLFGMYPRSRRAESSRRGEAVGSSLDRAGGSIASRRSIGGKVIEADGAPLVDKEALKSMIRLLRVVQPIYKGQLQKLLLNLCAHHETRAGLVQILMDMLMLDTRKPANPLSDGAEPSYRLYSCQSYVMYSRPQFLDGVPPLVSRRILETLTYLARNHPNVAKLLLQLELPRAPVRELHGSDQARGKAVMVIEEDETGGQQHQKGDVSIVLLLSLLNLPLYLRSVAHLEQLLNLLEVVIDNAESNSSTSTTTGVLPTEQPSVPPRTTSDTGINSETGAASVDIKSCKTECSKPSTSGANEECDIHGVLLSLPQAELRLLCSLLAREGLSDNAYVLVAEVLKKLVAIAPTHCHLFITELAASVQTLSRSAIDELNIFGEAEKALLSTTSSDGTAILRVLQALSSLVTSLLEKEKDPQGKDHNDALSQVREINAVLEPLWLELSTCISKIESYSDSAPDLIPASRTLAPTTTGVMPPLPAGTQNVLPYIESFFVTCEKLDPTQSGAAQDFCAVGTSEVGDATTSAGQQRTSGSTAKADEKHIAFVKFSEKHRKLLNSFIRQNPGLLEKSFSLMLKVPRFIDFDNKRAHFRSKIKHQHDHHHSPLRISVRRAYILEDSYNQLRMRSTQDLKGRLTVHFQGEEGIDAGGLTREWYQLLSRVIFDKGALLFTTVGNESTFQPNPNSVYQTEHLSYFKFVGRVVGKALFDGQLLDVHFTRSFYKHILGVKVTYHDIEAIDPDYFKNLKWMLENDISDVLDLTFSMDADEEKLILYERAEVTDYELIPGGRNIRVTEENKHEYVDLVAEHRLTTAIRPQINAFLEGFTELIPPNLISIFNDKELELLISGLPDIDLDDMRANTEYSGYSAASPVIQWFWEVAQGFSKEDKARLLQFVTGTSKVPLEGFSALQGISGSQRFQIHKAYGSPDHLPSAHTCFNQLDLPEYPSKQHLEERLLLAIHEANEGFGFG
ncbi:Ubiquitin-associated domain/translation elongation factor EF-Ts [Macleaya cordata]|uniref:HECT-type E3 ubiquitin transferase n=1 Tax=Macleaya cordata TaxID=56857 RepID=A0A200PUD2_MACCD|nr:Ubiquitin-associated domain/translation elongation factor EF-Ts [Macleaya cordata]